ncbi:1,4-dihydroxy-2-naphthoate octaprenyltransferase [Kineothrix alysoides]|uniref:1,4-dihydroxy-2-naphthoate octaprenyltransferase n=1 Tax=Kineothrix alysoides TaxID=1469948 RepID=A0A4V2QBT1_9FIRM|nr:UbiA family prenyltransferase [Kineothrix alysoides]TCL57632.1 1,4-dihydroxy-2-naphthoate octaprenyltransferase [Kineothrix alysoides]
MKAIKNFFILVRWEYLPSAINETGIPALLALLFVPFSSQYVFRVIMSLLIWYGAHFIGAQINNISDYESDKKFKSYISDSIEYFGMKKVKQMIIIETIIVSALTIGLTIVRRQPMLLILWLIGLFFAYAYSGKPFNFKRRTVMNPITLALVLYLIPMLFAYLLIAGDFHGLSVITILIFGVQMVPMFFMDEISDYEEDKEANVMNPCVRFGRRKTVMISIIIGSISNAAMLFYWFNNISYFSSLKMVLFIIALLFFVFVILDYARIYRMSEPSLLRDESKLMKLKKSIHTPVWLMGTGAATLLLIFESWVK